jgi:outer membrane murein-binding lipoprotein Lpp
MSMKTRRIVIAAVLAAILAAGCAARRETSEVQPRPSTGELKVSGEVKTGLVFRN